MNQSKWRNGRAPVLVVDDGAADCADTVAVLVADGFVAVPQSDGDAALRHARSSLTLLLVSELYIPCAEGVCIVAVLKRDRARLPRLRILVHTRHSGDTDTEWALAAGCDAIVYKASAPGVLVRELGRLEGFAA